MTAKGRQKQKTGTLALWIEARQRLVAAQTAQQDFWDALSDFEKSMRALFPESLIEVEGDDIIEGAELEDLMKMYNLKEKVEDE